MRNLINIFIIIVVFTTSINSQILQSLPPQLKTALIVSAITPQGLSESFNAKTGAAESTSALPTVNNGINAVTFDGLGGLSLFVNQANDKLYAVGAFNQSGTVSFSMVGLDCTNAGHDNDQSYYAGKYEQSYDLTKLPNGNYIIQISFEAESQNMITKTFMFQLSR
jgi:hypothetical protein